MDLNWQQKKVNVYVEAESWETGFTGSDAMTVSFRITPRTPSVMDPVKVEGLYLEVGITSPRMSRERLQSLAQLITDALYE